MMDPETLKDRLAELEQEKMLLSYDIDHLSDVNEKDRQALDQLRSKRLPARLLALQAFLAFASGVLLGFIIYAIV